MKVLESLPLSASSTDSRPRSRRLPNGLAAPSQPEFLVGRERRTRGRRRPNPAIISSSIKSSADSEFLSSPAISPSPTGPTPPGSTTVKIRHQLTRRKRSDRRHHSLVTLIQSDRRDFSDQPAAVVKYGNRGLVQNRANNQRESRGGRIVVMDC